MLARSSPKIATTNAIAPTAIAKTNGTHSAFLGQKPAAKKAALSVSTDNNRAMPPSSGSIRPKKTSGKDAMSKALAII